MKYLHLNSLSVTGQRKTTGQMEQKLELSSKQKILETLKCIPEHHYGEILSHALFIVLGDKSQQPEEGDHADSHPSRQST